jgi:hypothetical protein
MQFYISEDLESYYIAGKLCLLGVHLKELHMKKVKKKVTYFWKAVR